ncbi:MAG: hypothetical protein D6797_07695, partial [Bdellovibrio sp.]
MKYLLVFFSRKKPLFKIGVLSALYGGLIACAPQPQRLDFNSQKAFHFGPQQAPSYIPLEDIRSSSFENIKKVKKQKVQTAQFLNMIEQLFWVSDQRKQPQLRKQAYDLLARFYQSQSTTSYTPSNKFPYAEALLDQYQDRAKKLLKEAIKQLKDSKEQILFLKNYSWPPIQLSNAAQETQKFFNWMEERFENSHIYKPVLEQFRQKLKQATPALRIFKEELQNIINNQDDLEALIASLERIYSIPTLQEKEFYSKIQALKEVNLKLNQYSQSAEHLFQLFVYLFSIMTEDTQKKVFKAQNESLYKFLKSLSQEDIQCILENQPLKVKLEDSDDISLKCQLGIIKGIKASLIIKKLKKIDVQKVHTSLLKKIVLQVKQEISTALSERVPQLNLMLLEKSNEEIDRALTKVQNIYKHFDQFLFGTLSKWAQKRVFRGHSSLPAFEAEHIQLSLKSLQKAHFKLLASKASSITSSSKTLGASLSLLPLQLKKLKPYGKEKQHQAVQFTLVNKLIALSQVKKSQSSFYRPPINLEAYFKKPHLFCFIPDQFSFSPQQPFFPKNISNSFHVSSQSELLRG